MSNIEIFFVETYRGSEAVARSGGFRCDVYVKINDFYYQLDVYDLIRFKQQFDEAIQRIGFYPNEPNTIFVTEVTNENIINTVIHQHTAPLGSFFQLLKPLDSAEVKKLNLTKIYPES